MNILCWAAALLALTLSCNKTSGVEDPEAGLPPFPKAAHEIDRVPLTRAEEAFVQAGNQFSWKLTKKVWDNGEKKSIILSPLSVQYALGMLGNGADAETSAQLAAVLGYEGTDAINEFCAKLIETLPQVDTSVTPESPVQIGRRDLLRRAGGVHVLRRSAGRDEVCQRLVREAHLRADQGRPQGCQSGRDHVRRWA